METKEHKEIKIEDILQEVAFTGICENGTYKPIENIGPKILAVLGDHSIRYICVAKDQSIPTDKIKVGEKEYESSVDVNGEIYTLSGDYFYAPNSKVLRSVWILRAGCYADVKSQLQKKHIFDPVNKYMRQPEKCRIAKDDLNIRDTFVGCRKEGRRVGAIMLVDREGKLSGIYTDSDLTKLLENTEFGANVPVTPIKDVMTSNPFRIFSRQPMWEALPIIANRKISELPVLDENEKPIGMLDITDLFGIFIEERRSDKESSGSSTRKENEQSQTSTH